MTLKEQLMSDMKEAMKNKDTIRKGVITLLRNGLLTIEKEQKRELTNDDELLVLRREIKQNQDSLAEAKKAARQDIIEQVEAKIAVVESYLPKQLTEQEVKELLGTLPIDKSMKMGQVIEALRSAVDGGADNRMLAKIAKEYLA